MPNVLRILLLIEINAVNAVWPRDRGRKGDCHSDNSVSISRGSDNKKTSYLKLKRGIRPNPTMSNMRINNRSLETPSLWLMSNKFSERRERRKQSSGRRGGWVVGGGTIITSLWTFEVASGLFPTYSKYRLSTCLLVSRHSKATFMQALPPSQRAIGSTRYPSLLTQCCVNPGKMTSICPKRIKDEDAAPAHMS